MEIINDSYKVELKDIFSGPLDLLLYLVKKEEIEIHEISISKIAEQYMHYIELLKMLDVNIAADFLVTAATLMHIKSHSLLPVTEGLEVDEEEDPRFELIKQLLEYKRYKDLALKLGEKGDEASKKYSRPKIDLTKMSADEPALDLNEVSVWDLFEKFSNLMKETLQEKHTFISDEDKPISEYMDDLLQKFGNETTTYFHSLFAGLKSKTTMIGLFLALLELVRQKKLKVEQDTRYEEIKITKRESVEVENAEVESV